MNKTKDKIVSCCSDHSMRIWDYARAQRELQEGVTTATADLLLAGHTDVVS